MAFKPSSANTGSSYGTSSIDGVEVKIADKYIPPKKVTLPMKLETSFQSHNPSEVLFMEYDFTLEEEVIKWSDAYRESKEAMNRVRAEQVATNIEQFTQQSTGSTTEPKTVDSVNSDEDVATCETKDCDTVANGDLHLVGPNEAPPLRTDEPKQDTNPFVTGLGMGILVPMQIPASKPQDNAIGAKESFNLADFERETEQDPFDNAELRVMNDMEELNKVLQNVASSAANSTTQTVVPSSQAEPAIGAVHGIVTNSTQVVSHTMVMSQSDTTAKTISSPPIPPRKNIPKSVKEIDYPSLDSVENNYQQNATQGYYNNLYGSPQKHLPSNGLSYALPNMYSSQANAVSYPSNYASTNPFSNIQSTAVSFNKNQNCLSGAMFPVKPSTTQNSKTGQAKDPGSSIIGQVTSPYNMLSHGSGYPNRDSIAPTASSSGSNGLRSVRSTPDISALADNAKIYFPKSHTPPPNLHAQGAYADVGRVPHSHMIHNLSKDVRSSTPPPKYTPQPSTNPWGPPTSHNLLPGGQFLKLNGHSPGGAVGHSPGRATSSLPDPYHSLPSEKKTLVDSVTAMGFPRARVARTVEKLGNDDKKIVDHLCLVTRLSEKNFPADDVETALDLYENNERKAETYLKLIQRFNELGFPMDSIKAALSESKLDENKTLDILTGNT